jgi:hypothetical protein
MRLLYSQDGYIYPGYKLMYLVYIRFFLVKQNTLAFKGSFICKSDFALSLQVY